MIWKIFGEFMNISVNIANLLFLYSLTADAADGVVHGQEAFGWHIIRNGVAGAKGEATVTDRFGNHVFDIFIHILGIQAAYCVSVNAAKVADSVAIFFHPV